MPTHINKVLQKFLVCSAEGLDIKINAQSSNGNTAFDWILTFDGDNPDKSKIIELLKSHGAKNAAALDKEKLKPLF